MSRGYRRIILAIAGLVLIGASQPPETGTQTYPAKEQQGIADSLKSIASSLQRANEPDQTTKPCDPEKPNRDSDLCAQWKAADAAADAAHAAWGQFWLGTVGLFLGAVTMFAAIAAAFYAKRAATETKTSNDHYIANERSWLSLQAEGRWIPQSEESVPVCFSGYARGRVGIELIGVHWRCFESTDFIKDESTYEFTDRSANWDTPMSLQGIAIIRVPNTTKFIGGWVTYKINFPGERRSYFLFRIDRGADNPLDGTRHWPVVKEKKGKDWPNDT